jgi:hypothetical protein
LCNECYKYAEKEAKIEKAVNLGEDDHKFYFTIEATGALPPKQIVKKAL